MRTPNRNRRRSALAALCAALVIALIVPAVGALSANYTVLSNGTSYAATVDITGVSRYMFADTGLLGESIPLTATNVTLIAENGTPVDFNWTTQWNSPSTITFPSGNYTLSYRAPIKDYHLQEQYRSPYNVSVTLPEGYSVKNPLLAGLSTGANVTTFADNTTLVTWNRVGGFDLRFYDPGREELLYLFAQFMVIITIVLLMPYFLLRKPPQQ